MYLYGVLVLLQSSEDGVTHLVDLVDFIIRARRLSAAMGEQQQDKARRPSVQKKRVSIASSTSVLSMASIKEEEDHQQQQQQQRKEPIPTMIVTSSDEEEGWPSTSSSSSSRRLVTRSLERHHSDASSHQFRRSDSANSLEARLRLITVDGMLASEKRIARPLTPPSTISGRSASPTPSLAREADDNRSFRKRFFRSSSLSEKLQEGFHRRASVVKKLKNAVRRPSSIRL
ncbi:hypothetical protein BJV82DRAFT_48133 [Fennellomyces sp. T-0311]|nr:hypothetical protein BJV82DRAFT_48133 [Fennellomyces sp. T-0311]